MRYCIDSWSRKSVSAGLPPTLWCQVAALAALIAKYDTLSAYQIAQVHAYRGESDKSFEWLERAYKQRDTGLPSLNTDPLFKNLRHDPRYTELLKKMRLPT